MKKYPFVKQSGIQDCGVACMSMLIQYYHGNIDCEYLRERSKTNRNGTTAYHIVSALNEIGMKAKGVQCDFETLRSNMLILPCIAHVIRDATYQHYIVIYELKKDDRVVIADPALGIQTISRKELEEMWDGVCIIAYPIKCLPIEKETSMWSFLKHHLSAHKKIITSFILLSLFLLFFSLITSFYVQEMILATSFSQEYLFFIFFFFCLFYVFKGMTEYVRNRVLLCFEKRIDFSLTTDIFNQIIFLPYASYRFRPTGDIVSRIEDMNMVKVAFAKILVNICVDFPLALVSLIVLLFFHPMLFCFAIIICLLYIILLILFRKTFRYRIRQVQEKRAESTTFMIESIHGFETIQALQNRRRVVDKFEKIYARTLTTLEKSERLYFFQSLLKEMIGNVGFLLLILLSCEFVIKKEMSVGELFTFQTLLSYYLTPIRNVLDLDYQFTEAKGAFQRIISLFHERKEIGVYQEVQGNTITCQNLSYSYDDVLPVLSGLNIQIHSGEKIMIMGGSGSGKSTFFHLLMKYYKATSGCLKIDDIAIEDYKAEAIQDGISHVSQNENLFTGTLYDNLCFYRNVSEKGLKNVVQICELESILSSHSLGYNQLIEENGFNLSGGQRQQIILGRALLKSWNLLLIDEGMSQMDTNLERKILKNLFMTYPDKTILFISHRKDNVDLCSRLLVFEHGKIVEDVRKNGSI